MQTIPCAWRRRMVLQWLNVPLNMWFSTINGNDSYCRGNIFIEFATIQQCSHKFKSVNNKLKRSIIVSCHHLAIGIYVLVVCASANRIYVINQIQLTHFSRLCMIQKIIMVDSTPDARCSARNKSHKNCCNTFNDKSLYCRILPFAHMHCKQHLNCIQLYVLIGV